MIRIGRCAYVLATSLLMAGCSSTLSPEDPTDIAAWMDLYDVPGVSVILSSAPIWRYLFFAPQPVRIVHP
jgi:hypothetical protein